MKNVALLSALLLALPPAFLAGAEKGAALVIVLVIDGLRPDSITPEVTPNVHGLKSSGVWYTQAHSVFPTVTRVNTASISTGMLPWKHGIASNALYLPEVSKSVVSNGDYRHLLTLGKRNGGRIVGPKTLGEYFAAAGIRYVAISSGSTGNAVLLNPTAPFGVGSLINPGFEAGARVAFPDSLNDDLISRFRIAKTIDADAPMLWTERVIREYVLETMRPQVIVNWMGRTDSAQHRFGVGSPQGIAALRLVDAQIGLLFERLRQLNLKDKCDFIVTSDHGFDYEPGADVLAPLRQSRLVEDDVVVDSEGGSTLFYVRDRDPGKIRRLAVSFQASPETNAIFVPSRSPEKGTLRCAASAVKGFVPGTFALELAGQCLNSGGPDIIVTHRWDSSANPFGVPGTQWIPAAGPDASRQAARNGHGGLNPYVTRSTLLAQGPDFAEGKTIELPAGNQDLAPTLLALFGVTATGALDGRVLSEGMSKESRGRVPKGSSRRYKAANGSYCAELDVSYAGRHAYLNYARRCAQSGQTR